MVSRGPAAIATAIALALVNLGLAALIVEAIGARSLAPLWVSVLIFAVGIAATVAAIMLWRRYLSAARRH